MFERLESDRRFTLSFSLELEFDKEPPKCLNSVRREKERMPGVRLSQQRVSSITPEQILLSLPPTDPGVFSFSKSIHPSGQVCVYP